MLIASRSDFSRRRRIRRRAKRIIQRQQLPTTRRHIRNPRDVLEDHAPVRLLICVLVLDRLTRREPDVDVPLGAQRRIVPRIARQDQLVRVVDEAAEQARVAQQVDVLALDVAGVDGEESFAGAEFGDGGRAGGDHGRVGVGAVVGGADAGAGGGAAELKPQDGGGLAHAAAGHGDEAGEGPG